MKRDLTKRIILAIILLLGIPYLSSDFGWMFFGFHITSLTFKVFVVVIIILLFRNYFWKD